MLSKKVGVVFLFLGLAVAIPSQAEVVPLVTFDGCMNGCSRLDPDCMQLCVDQMSSCQECCHIKQPGHTKEHCIAVCSNNLKAHTCKK